MISRGKLLSLLALVLAVLLTSGCSLLSISAEVIGGNGQEMAGETPSEPEENPYEPYEQYRVNKEESVLRFFEEVRFTSSAVIRSFPGHTIDLTKLETAAPGKYITLWDQPYLSPLDLTKTFGYEVGQAVDRSLLLKKKLERGTLYLKAEPDEETAVLLYEEGTHLFQKDLPLHGKPYKKDGEIYLPLADLLEFTGHRVQTTEDPALLSFQVKENTGVPALDFFLLTSQREEEGYYKILMASQVEKTLDFILLGDLALATNFGRKNGFDRIWSEYGGSYILKDFQEEFEKADMVVANLENVFTAKTKYQPGKIYNIKAPRIEYVDVLPLGGITHVNIINNHMTDYLDAGFRESLGYLEEKGIKYFGTNETRTDNVELGNIFIESYEVFEKDGIRVGLLGYFGFNTSHVSDARIKKDVDTLRNAEKVDFIVASMHWGGQDTYEVTWKQKEMGRKLIDFGVDVVYGHHPHVLQEVEVYQGKPIYYSFGNFLFLNYYSITDPDSVMVNVSLTKDRFGEIHSTFTHKPVYWGGHPTNNQFMPTFMDREDHISRTLRKLKIRTLNPIDFSKEQSSP